MFLSFSLPKKIIKLKKFCCLLFFKKILLIFRERGWERERKGEKHQSERETLIGCLLHVSRQATQASALTRNGTGNLSVCRMMPNQLSHTAQGCLLFFNGTFIFLLKITYKSKLYSKAITIIIFNPHLRYVSLILESEGGRERTINGLPSICSLTGDQTHSLLVHGTMLQSNTFLYVN